MFFCTTKSSLQGGIDVLEQKVKLLDELGFNTNLKGAKFFISASDQLQDFLDNIGNDLNNVYNGLPNNVTSLDQYIDCIFVDDYGFYFECGKNTYLEEMSKFIDSREIKTKEQKELNHIILGNSTDIKDILLKISMYLNKEKEKAEERLVGKKLF